MGVIEKARGGRHRWQLFKEIEPGHRFQTRYNNHRQRRQWGETWRYERTMNVVGGLALVVAGFAFVPTPGPSYIILIGMWMLAGEFPLLARFFDRVDARSRELGRRILGLWIESSGAVRTLIALTLLLCIAALGYWLIT